MVKQKCPICRGAGKITRAPDEDAFIQTEPIISRCLICNGSGEVISRRDPEVGEGAGTNPATTDKIKQGVKMKKSKYAKLSPAQKSAHLDKQREYTRCYLEKKEGQKQAGPFAASRKKQAKDKKISSLLPAASEEISLEIPKDKKSSAERFGIVPAAVMGLETETLLDIIIILASAYKQAIGLAKTTVKEEKHV